jgi:hypothetical protein
MENYSNWWKISKKKSGIYILPESIKFIGTGTSQRGIIR